MTEKEILTILKETYEESFKGCYYFGEFDRAKNPFFNKFALKLKELLEDSDLSKDSTRALPRCLGSSDIMETLNKESFNKKS